jgi:hypothetical protein
MIINDLQISRLTALSADAPPRAKVVRCLHPNGDITVLNSPPDKKLLPVVLLSTRPC